MSSQNRLWVLGAADPEMAAIETLLSAVGEKFVHATVGGVRVHPGNAYKADALGVSPVEMSTFNEFVFVECDVPVIRGYVGVEWFGPAQRVVKVDHHRPGDPGYGRQPEEYLAASSLGQVIALLRPSVVEFVMDDGHPYELYEFEGPQANWSEPRRVPIPMEVLMVSAADHCLEAAYRGKCPGVNPERLMRWRAESRAAFQKRPVQDVLADVEAARGILRYAVGTCPICGQWAGNSACSACEPGCEVPQYADLRGRSVPELPEAAAREGIAFLSAVKDKDGREKVVLQAAPAELVRQFLAGEVVKGLIDLYGDPARGFAGGYIKQG